MTKTIKEMGSMKPGSSFISPGDVKSMVQWLELPKNHAAAADAVAFAPEPKKDDAFIDFLAMHPEFQGWDRTQLFQAVQQADQMDLMEKIRMEGRNMKKGILEGMIKNAVQKGVQAAIQEAAKPKTVKISRKQLAEGVRKGVLKALKENAMSGGVAPTTPPPAAPNDGKVPTMETLQESLSKSGGWNMSLVGEDANVFNTALLEAGLNPHNAIGLMQTGKGMHEVLSALKTYGESKKSAHAVELAENILHALRGEG